MGLNVFYIKSSHTIDFKIKNCKNSRTLYWVCISDFSTPQKLLSHLYGRIGYELWYVPVCMFLYDNDFSKSKLIYAYHS